MRPHDPFLWLTTVLVSVGLGFLLVRLVQRPSAAAPAAAPAEPGKGPAKASAEAPKAEPGDDPIVGPSYPYLSAWTSAERRALYDAQKKLGLDIGKGALPGVIQHESGGDPTVPKSATGTPRAGLIQITTGANLPGFTKSDAVWAARALSIVEQLDKIVVPLWSRFGNISGWDMKTALRKNFLPSVANEPGGFVLGVRPGGTGPNGETSDQKLPRSSLSYGAIFSANSGFARGKDYFTWDDVDHDSERTLAKAKGWIRISGKIEPNMVA